MDDKYNEAIDLYMAGKYREAIEAMALSKTVAPDVYQQFVKQCRNLDPQIAEEAPAVNQPVVEETTEQVKPLSSQTVQADKSKKGMVLNAVIALLVIANLTVAFLWIKGCMSPKSVMEDDIDKVSELLKIDKIDTRNDSISYALGCYSAEIQLSTPNQPIITFDETARLKVYAGMYQEMKNPSNDNRKIAIGQALPHTINPDLENRSNVGEINGDAVFQGIYDVATTGRNPLLGYEECGTILRNSFK